MSPRTRISPSSAIRTSTPPIGLPTDAARRAERMIERDDRRRFGEAVALHDEEAELAPERLELRIERRRAADDAPELPAEQPMHARGSATSARASACRRATSASAVTGSDALDVLAQHVEHLRHADEHRDAPRLDLTEDLGRAVAVREDDRAVEHRRHERRHRLPEHVAERQQVQEPDRMERPLVLPVLRDLALDRDDVREDVAVRDRHALRIGRRAGGEDDLGERGSEVEGSRGPGAFDGFRACAVRRTSPSRQLPDRRASSSAGASTSSPTQHGLRLDDRRDAREQIGRRADSRPGRARRARAGSPRARRPTRPVLRPDDDLVVRRRCRPRRAARRTPARASATSR